MSNQENTTDIQHEISSWFIQLVSSEMNKIHLSMQNLLITKAEI